VAGDVSENLGLPLLRGNPFDLRPIESGRAEYLVGRDRLIASWREHIISQSPRMLLLVGERGSGRSSVVRTLASQTRRSFIGQYWPTNDPVNAIIHELAIHFCGFSSSGSNQKMIDDLVSNLEESSGSLPVISLDYPSNIEISMLLNSISPILQRLRALVIIVLTPSQLSSIDEETLELYDRPEYTTHLSKEQIQELSNRLVSRKAREKWIIDDILLSRIHESTSGNPRDVIRLLRDLIDERRDVGAHGSLERLMRWKITHEPSYGNEEDAKKQFLFSDESQGHIAEEDSQLFVEDPSENRDFRFQSTNSDSDESIQEVTKYIEDQGDILPSDDLEEYHINFQTETGESQVNREDFSEEPDDLWEDDSDNDVEEITVESNTEQGTLDDFVYMQPGTEPPMFNSGSGFNGLAQRSKLAQSQQPNEEEDTPIIESVSEISHLWEGRQIDIESNQPENNIPNISNIEPEWEVEDPQLPEKETSSVISTDSAHWSVEPSMASSLPVFENPETEIIDTPFGIEDAPVQPIDTIENKTEKSPRKNFRPTTSWEPDNPLDEERITYLNEAEMLVISMASKREISPSDAELQARLEVGRPRLSQIYNGLYKSGYLSVRKQGRKRLFKITEAAQKLVEA
tara:strand:+ start:25966 stop:27855 length:1890 start_codon:yes stop_codon:yes gene_type:complete